MNYLDRSFKYKGLIFVIIAFPILYTCVNVDIMRKIYLYIILFLFSCQDKSDKLEYALERAGNNRAELEKVLYNFSREPIDSLKLEAAKFLIENMPGHFTLYGEMIDGYRRKANNNKNIIFKKNNYNTDLSLREVTFDSITYFDKKIFDILLSHSEEVDKVSERKYDITYIKADFLIRHINATFELLNRFPWLQGIPKDIFFEYLLPYRIENEIIDNWRDSICFSSSIEDIVHYYDNIKYNILQTAEYLSFQKQDLIFNGDFINHFLNIDFQTNCYDMCISSIFRYRALGIPAALDFIPYHPNRNGQHYWCSIISPEVRNGNRNIFINYRAAKIFRYMYSLCNELTYEGDEYIPELFTIPFIKDVTSEYLNTSNLQVKILREFQGEPCYGYLCVFNELLWQPIGIGKIENKEVKFKNMGRNIVYLPIYFRGENKHILNYPFTLDLQGRMEYLIPNKQKPQQLTITRKYPFSKTLHDFFQDLDGVPIECANDPTFSKVDTLITFQVKSMGYLLQNSFNSKQYRYFRIKDDRMKILYIAELRFYDEQGNVLKGKYNQEYLNAFDENPLTNVTISNDEFVIDFEKPVNVTKVICVPRGDGNGIYPNNKYELFYFALDGWCSLGQKIATDYYIKYDNVPSNALLWLRNLTTGIEERPFTVKEGEIRFW